MIVYIPHNGTPINYVDMTEEVALEKFKDEALKGKVTVLSIADDFVQKLTETVNDDVEEVEWEEVRRDFAKA